MKILLDLLDLLDDPRVTGESVVTRLKDWGVRDAATKTIGTNGKTTDFVNVLIPGRNGKTAGGNAPTLGIVGRLGGLGARPALIGFTSDGDGALAALTIAAKLGQMHVRGDILEGDVMIRTHVCPNAPTRPHEPVPFMDSPITSAQCNAEEVDPAMDALLSIDTTKGNRILNARGIAITPTVKDGYLLRTSEDLLSILESTTGCLPKVLPLAQQDITPYGNNIYHINSILQPSVATTSPCIGVAITTQSQVAGCATGATHVADVDEAVRFSIEVAQSFTAGKCRFYDPDEYELLVCKYGTLSHFRTMGIKA